MNELDTIDSKKIENMIFEIRGKQVILDKDVAKLYNLETRIINQVVKRNQNRFPIEFCFRLTEEELSLCSRSQNVILNENKRGYNAKYFPYVFLEVERF